jgi:Xaa-Pro aminopeptidase
MTILKVTVEDDQVDELKKLLHEIDIVKSIEEEQTVEEDSDSSYSRIKRILDSAKGKNLFKDIDDPVQWQREIRKEWDRDL